MFNVVEKERKRESNPDGVPLLNGTVSLLTHTRCLSEFFILSQAHNLLIYPPWYFSTVGGGGGVLSFFCCSARLNHVSHLDFKTFPPPLTPTCQSASIAVTDALASVATPPHFMRNVIFQHLSAAARTAPSKMSPQERRTILLGLLNTHSLGLCI